MKQISCRTLTGILFLVCGTPAQAQSVLLRYGLRPGDHLFYRQTLEREAVGGRPDNQPAELCRRLPVVLIGAFGSRPELPR